MRDRIWRKLLNDNRGSVISIFLLALVPMFVIGLISLTESTNIMRGSDSTLQNAVTVTSRHAAMMVDPSSQAKGEPLIDHRKAYDRLSEELNYTLGANSGLKTTIDSSSIKWWMLVYNGKNTYKGMEFASTGTSLEEIDLQYTENVMPYAYYSSEGAEVITDTITGFPQTLYVSDQGILDYETTGSVKITINDPGVLIVINANINSIMIDGSENTTRWAYAKVAKRQGGE